MKPAWRLRSWQFITAQSLVGLIAVGTWSQAQEQASTNAASTAADSSQTGTIAQPSQPKLPQTNQPNRPAKKSGNSKTTFFAGLDKPTPPAKSVFRFDLLGAEPTRSAIVIPENIPNRPGMTTVASPPSTSVPNLQDPKPETASNNLAVESQAVPSTPSIATDNKAESQPSLASAPNEPIVRTADASRRSGPASSGALKLAPPSGEQTSAPAPTSETRIATASELALPQTPSESASTSMIPEAPPLDPPSLPPLLPSNRSQSNGTSDSTGSASPKLLTPKNQTDAPQDNRSTFSQDSSTAGGSNQRDELLDAQARMQAEQYQERVRIAKLVSQQNLSSAQPSRGMPSVPSIEAPPGWQAIEQKLRERLQNCELMLRRNALYSARQESLRAMHELCQMLDLRDPGLRRDAALSLAVLALKEEEDFHRSAMLGSGTGMDVKQLVTSHQTPVLKSLDASSIAPLLAAQHYRAFARSQFVIAADQHPWAADLLYAHGKALESLAKEHPNKSLVYNQQAEVLYEAALETNPKQAVAATQLGFVLLQLDRAEEARQVLLHGTNTGPTIQTWENLAESFRRVGDGQGIEWARQNYAQTAARNPPRDPRIPEQHEHLDPETFAAISPRYDWMQRIDQNPSSMPPNFAQQGGAMNMLPPNATYPVAAPRNQVQPQAQTARSGWISGFFR